MTATMSTCEHARFHPRSNSHAHTVAHTRAFAKILAHTRVRARACQCTGQQGAALGQVLLLPCAEDPRRVLADARLRLGLPRELQPPHLPVGSRPPASAEEYEEYPLEYQEYPGGLPPASVSGRQALGRRSSLRIRRAVATPPGFAITAPEAWLHRPRHPFLLCSCARRRGRGASRCRRGSLDDASCVLHAAA